MQSLTLPQPDNADSHRIVLHPGVTEALARLDYPRPAVSAAAQHIIGMRSLRKAPVLNPASLRARGLNESALEKIEAYIPCVTTLRLAITPWIIGLDFCRTQLKIPARLLESPRFDLLSHWGFTAEDVRAADLYCYGHQTARNAKCLHLRHRPLFGCGTEIATEARLRMAAAVQSFISGNTGIVAYLPTTQSITRGAETTLAAWRSGLKAITLVFDPTLAAPRHVDSTRRKIKASAQPHAQPISALPRRAAQVKRMPLSPSGKKPASIKVV